MNYSSGQVLILGMGIVFIGLVCIVFITMLMGAIMKNKGAKAPAAAAAPAAAPAVDKTKDAELVAVITAALTAELGPGNATITAIKKA